ncbi:carbon-nitrogen hydrolase [Stutzerimonas zhaodongensis]|uniref:carbon-nitrogen hydrolase n=1 Tax=Stutzerimonas zhaodongensis TaxID=1176257 RepID=UPI0021041453|nr:carbon-nitrogen hydrolase [Stutzerimonas zhaodongensis]MCQ2029776.1 carbon-nitrogen hydrolase [Stutzerimonas zhaodongensis]
MRTHSKYIGLILIALAALLIYLDWTADRRSGPLLSDLRILPIEMHGEAGEHGNLLAIETRLMPADYQSRERLSLKFTTYLDQARDAGLLSPRTVVVLPEHVGTGLFALGEKPEVQQARTLRDAMQWMALSNPWDYLRALRGNKGDDRRTEAALKFKGEQMAEDYQLIFGNLAREYGITLVAGTIVLPEPRLEDGRLKTRKGSLRQISLGFGPGGEPFGSLHYKSTLNNYERRYSVPIQSPPLAVPTPAGRLAVMIGCDGYRLTPPPDAELLAIVGAPDDPASACGAETLVSGLPRVEVRTLGLPWNLIGSPHRPMHHHHTTPVRLHNLWLPERP